MKKIIAIALLALLAACKEAPSAYTPEPFTFETQAPISINVAEIKVVENFQSPLRRPNAEYEFPVPPAIAVKKWVSQRLKATGTSGILEISIDDASVKEVPLKKTEGVQGIFTDDPDARYDARIAVTMRVFTGERAISAVSGDVEVTRSRTINEKATLNEREQIYHQMTQDMLARFDAEANKRLRQYFFAYLR